MVSIVVSIVQVARLAQTVMERAFAKSGLRKPTGVSRVELAGVSGDARIVAQ